MNIPIRQIRAFYNEETIRVYQAYNDTIADSALQYGRFVSPPFKQERMTWIKPSFLWMMYRAGWGKKDAGQNRILAIDISHEGFEWALTHSLLSHQATDYTDKTVWQRIKASTPVRIQWDPERDLHHNPLHYRTIQIGLTNEAVPLYVNQWIQSITDITELATEIHELVLQNDLTSASRLLPKETEYQLKPELVKHLAMD